MSESSDGTARSSAEAAIKSDLAKVDAHVITPDEYDEIPELTDEMIERAEFWIGDRFIRRGPPGTPEGSVAVTLLPAIVDHFRAAGPGWQARINAVLMEAVERERAEKAG